MKKKGFTLVELLAVLVIIGILLGIAVTAVAKYMNRGKKEYYNSVEVTLKAAAQDYTIDYKSLLPREIGNTTVVTVEELVKNNYIDEILDENKEPCTGSTVTIEKTGKNKYEYYVCLRCNDKYKSDEKNCEVVGDNNVAKNYKIELNTSLKQEVEQCESLVLPTAKVYQIIDNQEKIINNNLLPNPNSVDTTILGETSVSWTYRYKSINKIVRVLDKVAPITPTVKITYLNGTEYKASNEDGSKNITNQDVNMEVTSRDYACPTIYPTLDGSGLNKIIYQVAGKPTNEIKTNKNITKTTLSNTIFGQVALKVSDKRGNTSGETTFELYVDKGKPTKTTVTYLGGSNSHSWKNDYKLELIATDDVEVAYYEVDRNNDNIVDETTSSIYIPVNGFSYCKVRFRAVDVGGNRGEWSDTNDIHMDTEAPSKTTVNLNGYTSGKWTQSNVTQTYTATDDLSKVKYYEYSTNKNTILGTTTSSWIQDVDGEYTLYARAIDNANNKGAWSNVYYIKKDNVDPKCTLKLANNPSLVDGYYIGTVQIDFNTKSDDRSELKSATIDIPTISTSTTTSGTKVTGTVVDNANNSKTCTITVKVDVTSPTITAKNTSLGLGSGDYAFTSNVTATYGNLGGTTTCNPANSNKTGTYNVTCTATGKNGKTAQTTFAVKHSYAATKVPKTCECKRNCRTETWCTQHYSCDPWDCSSCWGSQVCSVNCGTQIFNSLCCVESSKVTGEVCDKYDCDCSYYTCPNGGTLSGTTCNY